MPELGPYGSVRGARGNSRPYRESRSGRAKSTRLTPTGHRATARYPRRPLLVSMRTPPLPWHCPFAAEAFRRVVTQLIKLHRAMKLQIFLLMATLAVVQPARACRSPLSHTVTLLDKLPTTAQAEPVVAVVEAIELLPPPWKKDDNWGDTPRVRVRVVEAIKGAQEGERFVVDTRGTTCDQSFTRNDLYFQTHVTNRRFFIAGQFEVSGHGDIVFGGLWRRDDATNDLIPVRRTQQSRDRD
jgi:hypothetical protein